MRQSGAATGDKGHESGIFNPQSTSQRVSKSASRGLFNLKGFSEHTKLKNCPLALGSRLEAPGNDSLIVEKPVLPSILEPRALRGLFRSLLTQCINRRLTIVRPQHQGPFTVIGGSRAVGVFDINTDRG